MTEPVTAHTQRFVRALWSLDHALAYARHYPAVSWTDSYARDAQQIGDWHARHGDPAWAARRARLAALLAQSDRLSALAELMGAEAMPGRERVTMLGGRLLRLVVLQQSALSENDAACSAEKGGALADAVLDLVERAWALVDAGLAAQEVEQVDYGPLVRARDECGPAAVDEVAERRARVLAALDGLGR